MDIARFEKIARGAKTRVEVETMRDHALAKGLADYVECAERVLLESFGPPKPKGGAKRTVATFRGKTTRFDSAVQAYLWLIARFLEHQPALLERQEEWHPFLFKGTKRRYFARDPVSLFPQGSRLPHKPGTVAQVQTGWFANINLNDPLKFEILVRVSALTMLEYPDDWEFRVAGAVPELSRRQEIQRGATDFAQTFQW